ncbi:Uncharacterised protein g4117 [Pycnogonum litorale]
MSTGVLNGIGIIQSSVKWNKKMKWIAAEDLNLTSVLHSDEDSETSDGDETFELLDDESFLSFTSCIDGVLDDDIDDCLTFEGFEISRSAKLLRSKKKWKKGKAHRQVKTFCTYFPREVRNKKRLRINHRIYKRRVEEIRRRKCPSVKGLGKLETDIIPQMSAFSLDDENLPSFLDAEVALRLVCLQSRELTPDDYELLLALDDSVEPKTISNDVLRNFETSVLTDSDCLGEYNSCAVCKELYVCGAQVKILPCDHVFHSDCIDTWLKVSSTNCPLDGLPVC